MSRYGAAMGARERWNERYARDGVEPFADAPAEWLVEHRDLLAGGGRALDVACGAGRNALYLAQLGYEVDAIDASDVMVDALHAAAQERGLAISPRVVDLEHEPLPPGPYDAIVMLNFLQRDLYGALQEALAPGGLLFYETFAPAHVEELGRSFNPAYLLERGELLQAFPGLEVVAQHEGVVERSGGPRGVAGVVARRPALDG
jgi:SAM-dependent methyltransferase